MAHAMRPANRFFAAFYRWSCSTQRASYCDCSAHHRPSRLAAPSCRNYSITRLPQRHDEAASGTTKHLLEKTNEGAKQAVLRRFDDATGASSSQQPTQTESISMKTAIRNLMRHVPSSVTVITVHATHPETPKLLPVGSAISSLTTVTLDPPHVSFNVKTPSRTLDAIRAAGGLFRVHFLANSPDGAKLAQHFTRGNDLDVLLERREKFRFARGHSADVKTSSPDIEASCVLASMNCELVQEVSVADHIVAIAKVDELRSKDSLAPTLFYHQGLYKNYNGTLLLDPQSSWSSSDNVQNRSAQDERNDDAIGEEKDDAVTGALKRKV